MRAVTTPKPPRMEGPAEKKAAVERVRREFKDSERVRTWPDYVNALKLISQVVFTRSSAFVLELIQNAEDAGLGLDKAGEVTIKVHRNTLIRREDAYWSPVLGRY